MRKTKIICSIGPASSSREMLTKLIQAGMNVARVNASHGTPQEWLETIENVKFLRRQLQTPVAIMFDLNGPDIRVGKFENNKVSLTTGQFFTLCNKPVLGNDQRIGISYPTAYKYVKKGDAVVASDGHFRMTVVKVEGTDIVCKVVLGGSLSNNKSVAFPDSGIKLPFINKKDQDDIAFAAAQDCDYVAASFVGNRQNLLDIKKIMRACGKEIPIISKIESVEGVENIESILNECAGLMVARGDLGVEYQIEQLPRVQKLLSLEAVRQGKILVTATEMLESMTERPYPTRAEATDVTHAVEWGSTAIMLSAESAVGKYPVEAVRFMANISVEAEKSLLNASYLKPAVNGREEAIAKSIVSSAENCDAKAIVVFTRSGRTAMRVSKFRPSQPIYAVAQNVKVYNQLAFIGNVQPALNEKELSVEQMLETANAFILANKIAKKGEHIVINASFHGSDTDLVLIHPVK